MSADPADPSANPVDVEEPDLEPDSIDLASGRELNIAGAEAITAARPVQLIVIAGPVDCGKTTLLTSLYESFQWGSFAGHDFAASETLVGFERRCFLARAASQRDVADTERTPLGEAAFLHLQVCSNGEGRKSTDLLLTDLSGEAFRLARDNSDECQRLEFLGRADHFALLIDGKKLATPRTRWSASQDAVSLLQALLDNRVLPASAHVEVLFSKWDDVLRSPDRVTLEAQVKEIEKKFRDQFRERLGQLRFEKIAARPRGGPLSFAFGLDKLLQHWIQTSHRLPTLDLRPRVQGTRESERFLARHFHTTSNR